MPTDYDITFWHYAGFVLVVIGLLALDLGVFHRGAKAVHFREALGWTLFWFTLSMFFAWGFIMPKIGQDAAENFVLGYIIELSLSMDNVLVMAVIFTYFRVPAEYQHPVLFWGILGALIMRGLMIWLGVELIGAFAWVIYMLGGFLVFTGVKMVFSAEQEVDPQRNPLIKLARKLYPVSDHFDGVKFITVVDGRKALTPLALVLLMVETTDLIFAVDSIPAIFGVTDDAFIIFTSNVCAILGLRSLYFVLVGGIAYFRYLKFGLSVVLIFIGAKMLSAKLYHISTKFSLLVVAGVLGTSVAASAIATILEKRSKKNK